VTVARLALPALALLAALAVACDGGGGGDNGGEGGQNTGQPPPAFTPVGGCVDREVLTPEAEPWEVGNDPVFFRFGLPLEALGSGEVCPADITLVVARVTGPLPNRPLVLEALNSSTGERLEYEMENVDVPGEEGEGEFFNATVALSGPGLWDFTVELGEGGSTTFRVPVGPA
jgi:hypothetical protein